MKRISLALAFVTTLSAFATNGGHLIGLSAISNGLGGTAVGHFSSATDSIYRNPALLTSMKSPDGSVTGELWTNLIKQNATTASSPTVAKNNQSGAQLMPELTGAYHGEDFAIGLSIITHGGARADYLGEAELSQIQASSNEGKLALGLAYRPLPDFSIGVAPFLGYADLALNSAVALPPVSETTRNDKQPHGATAFGAVFGAALHSFEPLTLGASFSTKAKYTIKGVADLNKFNLAPDGTAEDLDIAEPMQFALGASYVVSDWTLAFDFRKIFWSKADGYDSLGWNDQNVIGVGVEYKLNDVALRAGYNYGKSPISDTSAEVGTATTTISGVPTTAQTISLMNTGAFPGVTESHLTLGLGYQPSETWSLDASFVYAFGKTVTRAGTGALGAYSYVAEVSQWSVGLGGSYRF